jgi:hypothetical protein
VNAGIAHAARRYRYVLTFRDGKVVKFQTAGDTALMERVFGSN